MAISIYPSSNDRSYAFSAATSIDANLEVYNGAYEFFMDPEDYRISINNAVYNPYDYPVYIPKSSSGLNFKILYGNPKITDIITQPLSNSLPASVNNVLGANSLFFTGVNGSIYASSNGINWTAGGSILPESDLVNVAYGNNLYVSVDSGDIIRTSTNGLVWTSRFRAGSNYDYLQYGQMQAYPNGVFINATSEANTVFAFSTDGITWTTRNNMAAPVAGVAIGNGKVVFPVAFGTPSLRWTTSLVVNDYQTALPSIATRINQIAFGNGIFVISSVAGGIATSTDAVTWTSRTPLVADNFNTLVFDNGLFHASYGSGTGLSALANIAVSSNAQTWTISSLPSGVDGNPIIAAANKRVVAHLGGSTMYAYREDYFKNFNLDIGGPATSIVKANDIYMAGLTSGTIRVSTDRLNWSSVINFTTSIQDIEYGNGVYLAAIVGFGSPIRRSTDSINWTSVNTGISTASAITSIEYGNNVFVAAANGGAISVSSNNGLSWTLRSVGTLNFTATGFGNGRFVVINSGGQSLYSADGLTWTTGGLTITTALDIAYNPDNGVYLAAGSSGTLASSTTGINWTTISTFGSTATISTVNYWNGLYICATTIGTIHVSSDITNWTQIGTTGTVFRDILPETDSAVVVGNTSVILGYDGNSLPKPAYIALRYTDREPTKLS